MASSSSQPESSSLTNELSYRESPEEEDSELLWLSSELSSAISWMYRRRAGVRPLRDDAPPPQATPLARDCFLLLVFGH